MIILTGMVGLGKTSLTELISKELNLKAFYEDIDNNKYLKNYNSKDVFNNYNSQHFILENRFNNILEASKYENSIVDGSLEEILLFTNLQFDMNKINFHDKEALLVDYNIRIEQLQEKIKSKEILIIYLKANFSKVREGIRKRNRIFEQSRELESYYYEIWENYDKFVEKEFNKKNYEVLTINVDNKDFIKNRRDFTKILDDINTFIKIK
jgi:deoxyadenosine/deoxycytidine kinase